MAAAGRMRAVRHRLGAFGRVGRPPGVVTVQPTVTRAFGSSRARQRDEHARARPGRGVVDRIDGRALGAHGRDPRHAVEPDIAEVDPVVGQLDREQAPARGPRIAADLEDVGHVDAEPELQLEGFDRRRVVDDRHLLGQLAVEPSGAGHGQLPIAQVRRRRVLVLRVAPELRVGQLDRVERRRAGTDRAAASAARR